MSARAKGKSISLDFYIHCVRCREILRLEPTKMNLRFAENLIARVKHEAATNTLNYREHFPDSKSRAAKLFGNPHAGNMTVKSALLAYYESKKNTWKKSTRETNYKIIINQLCPAFIDIRLADLSVAMIRNWLDKLQCSNKRKKNILIPLNCMLNNAHIDGLIEENPINKLPKLKAGKKEPDPFTPNEIKIILQELPNQAKNFYQFAFYTGLRTGELIALCWSDIDWEKGSVCVRRAITRKEESSTKTDAGVRYVRLYPPAITALENQKSFTINKAFRIFHNPKTKKPWIDDGQIRKRFWIPALKSAGVRYRCPYQTRHTFASSLLTANEHPAWIAQQLGHTNSSVMFDKYARWIPEMFPNAGDKINAEWSQYGH
jgi:integrase